MSKLYYQEHKEEYRAYHKAERELHRERCYEAARRCQWKAKIMVIDMLGGKCCKCGNTDIRVLQVNHINGGGSKEVRGWTLYRKMVSGERKTDDLNLLCANCNIIYEFEQGRRLIYEGG